MKADEFHKRGFEYRKQGNFSLAVEEYSKALELDPYHFKAFFNRAFAYDKLHDYPHAVADYTSAIALDPQNSYAYYNRGITFDKLGDYQLASEDFKQALSLQSPGAAGGGGGAYSGTTGGANTDFIYNLALSLKKLNQLPEAIIYFQRCLEIENGKHLKSLQSLGNCHEQLGSLEEAMRCYDKALEMAPQHITSLISKAHLLHVMGGEEQCQLSIRFYSSILDLLFPDGGPPAATATALSSHRLPPSHPNNEKRREEAVSIIFSRAHVYEDLNDLKSAIRDLTLAIELASQGTEIGNPSGATGAAASLRDGLAPIPLSVLYSTRGVYYKAIEKYEQAIGDFGHFFDHFYRLHPQGSPSPSSSPPSSSSSSALVSVYNHRGYCYRKLDQYPQAIADYTEAISLHPNSIKGYNNRAYCYAKIGDYQKAIRDYTSVLVIDELNAHAYHNRGISYDKLGIFDKAIEDFSKVIELDAAAGPSQRGDRPHPLGSSGGNDQHQLRHTSSTPTSFASSASHPLPSSGRSTPGLFTPIRSNDIGSGGAEGSRAHRGDTINQSRTQPTHGQPLTLRARTPTNATAKPLERNGLRSQGSGGNPPHQRLANKSPTPTATGTATVASSRPSLQESIRAKMVASPSPRSKTRDHAPAPSPLLVDSQVTDQIVGIQDAARRLASFSAPKNKIPSMTAAPAGAVSSSSSSGLRSHGRGGGVKLSSAASRNTPRGSASPSLSSSLDDNGKSFPPSRGVMGAGGRAGSHRQLPSATSRSLL
jgi:tetratricopeptide (TPR) repeat protein